MASVSYRMIELHHDVYQPQILPIRTQYPPPPSVQIELTIILDLSITTHDCLARRFVNNYTDSSSITHRFNLDVLKNQDRAYKTISPLLARFRLINPSPSFVDVVIDKIIRHGLRIANWESNKDRKILPLRAKIWGSAVKLLIDFDRDLIRRLLAVSASEFETSYNHGMVPAEKSMVMKMLKRVRVQDSGNQHEESSKKRLKVTEGEDCVICLEEIKIGSAASRMPCSHTFHDHCIETWLNQSHYCPICRFEMPLRTI